MRELLIGCGNDHRKKFSLDAGVNAWSDLTTLDIDANTECDVTWDLENFPYPFPDDTFDEIHAYEVLEHLGSQGDYEAFFALFTELWRISKPGGVLHATCPWWESRWAWGDPGHRRIISAESLVFLSQGEYEKQVGVTPMTDYRWIYKADWEIIVSQCDGEDTFLFALKAVK